MQKISANPKLLLGLFLVVLSGKVMCASISADEEDKLKKQLTSLIDGIFSQDLTCPSYVEDEVKSCIMRGAEKDIDDYCTGVTRGWHCYEFGVRECEDGSRSRFLQLVGPSINGIALSHGCPAVVISVTITKHYPIDTNRGSLKPKTVGRGIIILVCLLCLFAGLISGIKKKINSKAQAADV